MPSREFIEALTGSTSSVISNAIVYPLDVITTKVQVRATSSAGAASSKWDLVRYIYKRSGILGFYIGMDIALIQTFWSNLAYFYIYSWIKKMYYKYKKEKGIIIELLQGALAGAISRGFTTPISVVTTRIQAGVKRSSSKPPSSSSSGYSQIVRDIYREDGISGFWRGYKASLILTINPAITYGVYEYLKKILPPSLATTPLHSFFIGAFTKSIATLVTYPYILCKTRMQAGSRNGITASFREALARGGLVSLFEGVGEQLMKSVICQALLFALKDYLGGMYKWIPVTVAIDTTAAVDD